MFCPKCGTENNDDSKFCKKCGNLNGLNSYELRIARNEIYARHGRMFQDTELQDYFDSTNWYSGYIAPEDFVDSVELTALERKNAEFIRSYE